MISASAPGKIILFGEHAVVHGQPAIAVPLSAVQVTVTAETAAPGSGLTIHAPDVIPSPCADAADNPRQPTLYNALVFPVQVTLEALGLPVPDLTLTVHSTIPSPADWAAGQRWPPPYPRARGSRRQALLRATRSTRWFTRSKSAITARRAASITR